MANPSDDAARLPFIAFNFAVEINVPGTSNRICNAAFAECDGLEMTMDVKTVREGGNNGRQIRLTGPMTVGLLTLKRGMTTTFDLWDWMTRMQKEPGLRADAEVVMFAADGHTERARFILSRCVPAKIKAPPLSGKDGMVAIEEFQLAYESVTLKRPEGQ